MPFLEKQIIFPDAAHFDLGGYVNTQNCHIWSTENPHAYIESTKNRCTWNMSLSGADVVWPPWNCYLLLFVKDKCYANKPETIKLLRTICVKYICTQSIMHSQIWQLFEWNYFSLLTGSIVLSTKKRNLRKYWQVFFESIKKESYLAEHVFSDDIICAIEGTVKMDTVNHSISQVRILFDEYLFDLIIVFTALVFIVILIE